MSFKNEVCDFCGRHVDPIGGDLAMLLTSKGEIGGNIDDLYWCGICNAGRYHTYQALHTSSLIAQFVSLDEDRAELLAELYKRFRKHELMPPESE